MVDTLLSNKLVIIELDTSIKHTMTRVPAEISQTLIQNNTVSSKVLGFRVYDIAFSVRTVDTAK